MSMVFYLRRIGDETIPEDPDEFYDFVYDEKAVEAGDLIDFDKAWHALHFVLTGSADPVEHPLCVWGFGEEVNEDNGYGPPLLMKPEWLRELRDALATVSDEDLKQRYDPQAMVAANIYIADALVDEGKEASWDYVAQGLPSLRRFAERCVQHGSGAISFIG
jgi:hypothetical protein